MAINLTRSIPVLTVKNRQLVKTLKFGNPKYVGDPINAIKVFNDKEVDELMLIDIGASVQGKDPDYAHLKEMAGEAFMPLGYGGGIQDFDIAQKVFQCGIEKVVLNTAAYEKPELISQIATHYGSQSVVISLDYKKALLGGKKPVYFSSKKNVKGSIMELAMRMEAAGAGEIILHNVDRDGTFEGYDLDVLKEVVANTRIPIVPLGGAGDILDFTKAIEQAGAHAVAASSMFIFKKNNRDSILINYQKIN
jgi:cyclase